MDSQTQAHLIVDRPLVDRPPRERILEAAVTVFANRGYDGSSLRDIARQANVAFQLISYHFGSKEQLWRAAVDLAEHRFLDLGRSMAFDLSGDLREQFRNHLRSLVIRAIQSPEWRKLVTHEYVAGSKRYAEVMRPKIKAMLKVLGEPYCRQVESLGIVTRYPAQHTNLILLYFLMAIVLLQDEIEDITGLSVSDFQSIDMHVDLMCTVLLCNTSIEKKGDHTQIPQPGGAQPEAGALPAAPPWGEHSVTADLQRIERLEVGFRKMQQSLAEIARKLGTGTPKEHET